MIANQTSRTFTAARASAFDDSFASFIPTPSGDAQKRAEQLAREVRRATLDEWLATLPSAIRPYRLVSKLERVALVLVERWDNRSGVLAYIDGLLLDDTAVRMWMVPEVVGELMRLATYLRMSRFH